AGASRWRRREFARLGGEICGRAARSSTGRLARVEATHAGRLARAEERRLSTDSAATCDCCCLGASYSARLMKPFPKDDPMKKPHLTALFVG
ncbi:hypothetical protein EJB05_15246, partial [Eragrostis curvula]